MENMEMHNLIAGRLTDAPQRAEIHDKYSGELIGSMPLATGKHWETAITSARRAFERFRDFSAERRAGILQALYDGISAREDEFVRLIVAEAGKPVGYARSEVRRALDNLSTGIRATLDYAGRMVPMDYLNGKGKTAYTLRIPYGPVLGISPFNFPLNLALHKIIPAVATGSPVLIKPAPQTPLTMGLVARILADADVPEGLVQIVFGTNEQAERAVRDRRFAVLSFTGSDRVGWHLKNISPARKVFLEMGGNAAAVVDDTAEVERAAKKLAYGSFLYAGQICISVQRIYVFRSVFDTFTERFLAETARLQTGDPTDEQTTAGPMISAGELKRIDTWIQQAVKNGARVLTGGKILDKSHNLYAPTVLTGVRPGMEVLDNEAFAPVVNILPVDDINAAIAEVNRSRYGLQAGLYSDSYQNIKRFIQGVETGGVIINDIPGFRIDGMPYGGVKDSGLGREGGRWALDEYTQPKLVVLS